MHTCVQNLNLVKSKVIEIINKKQLKTKPEIIAITKTFQLSKFKPLLELGHIHFGENKIQEAESKWVELKKDYKDIKLHMVGKLQSNKAKKAVKLFDYIHSLDNAKLALKISQFEKELNKKTKLFIQVNLAEEKQKSGEILNDMNKFFDYCTKDLSLNIVGLMGLPPVTQDSNQYFKILKEKSREFNLDDLSMGMSDDYENALIYDATFLILGTAIFGSRNN